MNAKQANRIKNRNRYLFWIAEIDRVIHEIATSGTASASLSAGGGSKSYTHADIDKLRNLRGSYVTRVKEINSAIASGSGIGIRHVVTVRSGYGI